MEINSKKMVIKQLKEDGRWQEYLPMSDSDIIVYNNDESSLVSTNVTDALNELSNKIDELEVGTVDSLNGLKGDITLEAGSKIVINKDSATNKLIIGAPMVALESDRQATQDQLDAHEAKKDNPHEVTKAQVGLGNADNTSDINKPVSTAQQAALDAEVIRSNAYAEGQRDLAKAYADTLDTATNTRITDLSNDVYHKDVIKNIALTGMATDVGINPIARVEGDNVQQALVSIRNAIEGGGAAFTIKKVDTTAGYFATYELCADGVPIEGSAKIDIPKDYLVKSGQIKVCEEPDVPITGLLPGDKYLDFVVNAKDGQGQESHIYIDLRDLVDIYTGSDGEQIKVVVGDNNVISAEIKSGTLKLTDLVLDVQDRFLGVEAKAADNETAIADINNNKLPLLASKAELLALNDSLAPVAKIGSYDVLEDKLQAGPGINISKDSEGNNIISNTNLSAVWGNIQGDIEKQGDLKGKLDLKANDADLSTVAKSGSYNDLSDKPHIPVDPVNSNWAESDGTKLSFIQNKPTIGDAKLTIKVNDIAKGEFTSNATTDVAVNIPVPVKTSEITNDSDFTTNALLESGLDTKVDKVSGKGLSANDFTDEYKGKVDASATQSDVTALTGRVTTAEGKIITLETNVSGLQSGKQDKITEDNKLDYSLLKNTPVIPDISGKADKTYVDEELLKKVDKVEGKGLSTEDYTSEEKTKLAGIEPGAKINKIEVIKVDGVAQEISDKEVNIVGLAALGTDIQTINSKIPEQATTENQLADKEFVNSSIATSTATFRGTVTSLEALKALPGDLNDYAYYDHNDTAGNRVFDRYKYTDEVSETTGNWKYEYTLNNSSFTAEEWAAIKSGITSDLVTKIGTTETALTTHTSDTSVHVNSSEKASWNAKQEQLPDGTSNGDVLKWNISDRAWKAGTAGLTSVTSTNKAISVADNTTAPKLTFNISESETNVTLAIANDGLKASVGTSALNINCVDGLNDILDEKVEKEEGKGLSENDFTAEYANKLDGIEDEANKYVHPSYVAHTASAVKIGNDATGHVIIGSALKGSDVGVTATSSSVTVDGTTFNKYIHPAGDMHDKVSGFYKFSTDTTSHIKSVENVSAADITALDPYLAGTGLTLTKNNNIGVIKETYTTCSLSIDEGAWVPYVEEEATKYYTQTITGLGDIKNDSHPVLDMVLPASAYAEVDDYNESWSKIYSAEASANNGGQIIFYATEVPTKALNIAIKGF